MITFGPRYSSLLATGRASGPERTGSDPANARKEDTGTLQQLTAASRARPYSLRGLRQPDNCDIDHSTDMPGWRYAFGLSKDEVKAATPPGTVKLVGMVHSPSITHHPLPFLEHLSQCHRRPSSPKLLVLAANTPYQSANHKAMNGHNNKTRRTLYHLPSSTSPSSPFLPQTHAILSIGLAGANSHVSVLSATTHLPAPSPPPRSRPP